MDVANKEASTESRATVRGILRVVVAGLLLGPAVSKFLTYGVSVQFFRTLAIPAPEIMVLLVGAVELAAAASFLFDRATRVSAILVVPVMVVAAATAGPTWQNLGVLGAVVLIVALGERDEEIQLEI